MTVIDTTETSIHTARAELISLLGTENSASVWMGFMNTIEIYFPVMSGSGRPKKAEIKDSLIGQLGFDSWIEFVEAPIDNGGLGWSINTWKQWSKAWAVVKQYPYLRGQLLTASMVVQLKKDLDPFPENADAFLIAMKERKDQNKNTVKISALLDEIETLKLSLTQEKRRSTNLKLDNEGLQDHLNTTTKTVLALQKNIRDLETENTAHKNKALRLDSERSETEKRTSQLAVSNTQLAEEVGVLQQALSQHQEKQSRIEQANNTLQLELERANAEIRRLNTPKKLWEKLRYLLSNKL